MSDRVYETKKNPFGDEEVDLNNFLVMKARPRDLIVPAIEASGTKIRPRLGGEKFQRGALLIDYWSNDWTDKDIEDTNAEMKKSNINWAFLAPAWDITSFDPIKIWNDESDAIQYDEKQLRNHIAKLRKDGFDVVIGPQLCCTQQPSNFEGKSSAWWDEFFRQYEEYVLYHARISEEMGIKVFVLNFPIQSIPGTPGSPADVEERYEKLYQSVRSVYKGRLALFDYACCGAFDEGIGGVSDQFRKNLKIFEKFDVMIVSVWNSISKTDEPTQEYLNQNMSKLIDDKVKYIYDRYKKPIILQTAYRSADGSSQGTNKFGVDLIDKKWKINADVEVTKGGLLKSRGMLSAKKPVYTYDGKEQAMVYEAMMKTIADREWIVGNYPFIYHMKAYDFPRHPDFDFRRKPAEKVLAEWYKAFKGK